MQEEENFGGVGVAFCEGEEVEIVVTNVEILLLIVAYISINSR